MEHTEEREPPDVMTSDTNNATKVEPKDAPRHKRHKFRKFRAYNRGTWNGPKRENKEVIRRQDNLHRYDSLASSLDLSRYQKSKGRSLLDEFDFRREGIKVDSIIFGICVVVANHDVDGGSRYWPQKESQMPDDYDAGPFDEVAESLGLGWRQQMSVIKKVQSKVNL